MIRDIIEFDNRINQHDQITPSRRRRAIATPQTPKICEVIAACQDRTFGFVESREDTPLFQHIARAADES